MALPNPPPLDCLSGTGRYAALLHLANTGETVTMFRFRGLLGVTHAKAQQALVEMQAARLLDVKIEERGAAHHYEIRVSSTGLRVAQHLRRANDVMRRTR